MTKELESALATHGYHVFVINTNEDPDLEKQAICSAIGKKVDGIILCPCQKGAENFDVLKKSGTPFVLIGRRSQDPTVDYSIVDDTKGGYIATSHLIERGHKEILILHGPLYISSAKERFDGYKKALPEHDIPLSKKLVREISVLPGQG